MPPEFRPDRLFGRLAEGGVDYVVIGGLAAQAHGSATFTDDIDICYTTDDENLRRLGGVLVSMDARLRGVAEDVPFVPDGRTLRHVQVLTLDTPYGKFDVLASPSGFPGYGARPNAKPSAASNATSPVASGTTCSRPHPDPNRASPVHFLDKGAALAARALLVEWAGASIRIASLEDLIAMKKAAGRPKDLIAVEELEAIQRILREDP